VPGDENFERHCCAAAIVRTDTTIHGTRPAPVESSRYKHAKHHEFPTTIHVMYNQKGAKSRIRHHVEFVGNVANAECIVKSVPGDRRQVPQPVAQWNKRSTKKRLAVTTDDSNTVLYRGTWYQARHRSKVNSFVRWYEYNDLANTREETAPTPPYSTVLRHALASKTLYSTMLATCTRQVLCTMMVHR